MCKFLPLLLFTPLLTHAQQPVKPVISPDYMALISNDTAAGKKLPARNSAKVCLQLKEAYPNQYQIKTIRERKGSLTIIPIRTKGLNIGGNYTISAAARSVNRLPSLQNEYVQGESTNGSLAWLGPETNEVFSYGPSLHGATPYDNNIFRRGNTVDQSISLRATIKKEYWPPIWAFSLKAGSSTESTVIPENHNTSHRISLSVERYLHQHSIAGSYTGFSSRFSNDNSNGFLNRVYQNALQTPVSFSNAQSPTLITGGQRAYSNRFDNPWFLLKDNGHVADRSQQTGSLSLQKKQGNLTFGVINTLDAVHDNSNLSLKPGTASFPAGLLYTRTQNDDHFSSNAWLAYKYRYGSGNFSSTARLNYIYNDEKVKVSYPADLYSWRRSGSDASFTYNTVYNGNDFIAGLNAGNKVYASNTSPKPAFFLPEISGFIASGRLFDYHLDTKLTAGFTSFYSEPLINHTLSAFMLTQLTPQESFQFIPATEVRTFSGLSPMQHQEFTSGIRFLYNGMLSLHADFSIRNTKDNVFPAYENNQLVVKNMADTRYTGLEVQLQFNTRNRYSQKFSIANSISFYKYSNTVTRVKTGYENHPLAGFSTVYKALVKGQPVGVIMGNNYLRDAAGKMMIGSDGYPLVNNQPSIIGNPTPEYTLKFSHVATWKSFCLDIDWDYTRGGDTWNGTQAVLDYYGRSALTGAQRNTTGYVFAGTLQNGGKNNIPVTFFDATQPVSQNRWVRYGYTGVAASYIQKADNIRLHNLSLAYDIKIRKYLQLIRLTAYAQNLLLWSAYKGADPNQLLYDQPGAAGLDFFNLPSTKTYGISASIQF